MKAERKKRRLHNDAQRLRNLARASAASSSSSGTKSSSSALKSDPLTTRTLRKGDLDATTLRMRGSTASMGKFDRVLPGEDIKQRGVKRSFDPNERDAGEEKKRSMAILGGLDGSGGGSKRRQQGDVVNARKAVRFESKGEGALALARRGEGKKGGSGGRGGKRRG